MNELPLASDLLLITGSTGSGKTAALAARCAALIAREELTPGATLVAAAGAGAARELAGRIAALLEPPARSAFAAAPFAGVTIDTVAFAIVRDGALAGGIAPDVERLEPHEAEEVFGRAVAPLFSAEWEEYLGSEIDPEISGLRAPGRFAAAVLRLIAKLRDAGIGPDEMLSYALRGAATFYGKTPNLAEPSLIYATRDEYRSSLMVGPDELKRQRLREIDLAKIVAKLYHSYLAELNRHGCLSGGDAIAEALRLLGEQPALARLYRERVRGAAIDDVHDLRSGELRLLQALFGKTLRGVTFAGAAEAATQTFAGARPEAVFKLPATRIVLPDPVRDPQLAAAARAVLAGDANGTLPAGESVRVHRLADRDAEVAFVTAQVAAAIAAGSAPARLAVMHRTARTLIAFEDALVDAGIPVALHGDVDLLARTDAGDALAALWVAVDPFRHAWLLRALEGPAMALSDASLATLCGEPANPQGLLFPLPPDEPDGDRRWDRRRDVRLATNVLRGERDRELSPIARERLLAFRARRARWAAHAREAGAFAAPGIIADSGLLAPRPGETAARTQRRAVLIGAVLDAIERYARRYPGAMLDDALAMLERAASAEQGPPLDDEVTAGVYVGAIDRLGARRFDEIFVVDVRAGSFPPYYVPDAFLFSASWGMIPKDAAGDAPAGRTAKFTWYLHHARIRDNYAAEHRRLLALAIGRAERRVTISVAGSATRGIGAPELASELAARLPGSR